MSELSKPEYWSNRYINRRNGWDNGMAHPFIPHVVSYLGDLSDKSVLVIGAGPGHDAQYLSHFAKEVVALDFAEEAKKHFLRYYPDSSVRYEIADFFSIGKSLGEFDAVFEHTLLCAIDPKRYADYFKSVEDTVKVGGMFAGVIWNDSPVGDNGPPFSVSNATVLKYLQPKFKIHVEAPVEPTIKGRENTETFILAKKILG